MQRIGQEVWIGPGKRPANVSRGESGSRELAHYSKLVAFPFLPFFVGFSAKYSSIFNFTSGLHNEV